MKKVKSHFLSSKLIKNNIRPQKTISSKDVICTVANFYNIDEPLLHEKTRRKDIVKPRQIAMYILREDFSRNGRVDGFDIKAFAEEWLWWEP